VRGVLSPAPLDFVDLLFDLERLEIVEFGLMGLELGMEFVFAGFFLMVVLAKVYWGQS
jgi:hypothetical protein